LKLDAPKVVEERERRGLSQDELANRAEISANTVLRVERGLEIRPITARRIARGLGLEVADLYPKADAPTPSREEALRRYAEMLQELSRTFEERLRENLAREGNPDITASEETIRAIVDAHARALARDLIEGETPSKARETVNAG
jgi:transcriptional regulator with XRE-family HTH domain